MAGHVEACVSTGRQNEILLPLRNEIFCDTCEQWSGDLERCEHCDAAWPENVMFRGPSFDRALLPMTLAPVLQHPGDTNS